MPLPPNFGSSAGCVFKIRPAKGFQTARSQFSEITRQNDQIDTDSHQDFAQRYIRLSGVRQRRNDVCRNPSSLRPWQSGRVDLVAHYNAGVRAQAMRSNGIDDCSHGTAIVGSKKAQFQHDVFKGTRGKAERPMILVSGLFP